VVATRAPGVPPALRDTLAQRNAQVPGGGVPGAGEPVIRHEPAPTEPRAAPADGGNGGIASVEGNSGLGRFQVVQAVKRPIARQVAAPQARVPSPPSQRSPGVDGLRAQGPQPHNPGDAAPQFNPPRAQISQQPAYSRPPAMHPEAPRYAAPVQHTEPPYHPPAPRTVNAPVMQRLEPRAQPQQPQRNEAPREAPRDAPRTQQAPHAAAPETRTRAEPHSDANRQEGRSHEDHHG